GGGHRDDGGRGQDRHAGNGRDRVGGGGGPRALRAAARGRGPGDGGQVRRSPARSRRGGRLSRAAAAAGHAFDAEPAGGGRARGPPGAHGRGDARGGARARGHGPAGGGGEGRPP